MIMEVYNRTHRYYTRLDAYLALGIFVFCSVMFFVVGRVWHASGTRLFVHAAIASIVIIGIALAVRRESPRTISLGIKNWWKSGLVGLFTGLLVFYSIRLVQGASLFERAYGGVPVVNFLRGNRFHEVPYTPLMEWLPTALLFIVISVVFQEVLFRGYVQTRLYGLFKSDWVATIGTGILFVLFFMPLHSVIFGVSIFFMFQVAIPLQMIWMFMLHLWLNLLQRLFNSLVGPIIFHILFSFHVSATLTHSYFLGF